MIRPLRDALVVAGADLAESLRSRKAVILMVLYLAGAMGATGIFVTILGELEKQLAQTLQVATTDRPGRMTETLLQSEEFQEVLAGLVGDADLAMELASVPPVALFYGWLALTFVPILVAAVTSDSIAGEVATGSCRFALFRVDRLSWCLGKLLGQSLLVAVGVFAGALGTWIVAFAALGSFEAAEAAWWLLRLGGRVCAYGFAWLGVTLCASQLTRSVHLARGMALLMLVAMAVLGGVLQAEFATSRAPVICDSLYALLPQAHRLDLWRPDLAERGPAMVVLVLMGLCWFALGHQRFARRDA